jgi:hypothetical protein
MTHTHRNILHDWKAARMEKSYLSQVEFLGSGIRTSFLRAWVISAVKVLFIFALMNMHIDFVSKLEENVSLLDQYLRNDYIVQSELPIVARVHTIRTPLIVSVNLEPRGPKPELNSAAVAGDSTSDPSSD